MFLPLQGGGREGDGVSVGVVLNLPYCKIDGTIKISAVAGLGFIIVPAGFHAPLEFLTGFTHHHSYFENNVTRP
jgi:hypothetical protein